MEEALEKRIREETGLCVGVGDPIATLKHQFTHLHITLFVFHCRLKDDPPLRPESAPNHQWLDIRGLAEPAYSKVDRKVIEYLKQTMEGPAGP